jgi:cob(I)alamin adenosyltransferase
MSEDQRAVAAGSVDETSAFVSACLATGEPTPPVRGIVNSILQGTQMISAGIREAREPSPELLEHLRDVTEASRTWARPAGATTLTNPGRSTAAAMLRLARAVSERAQRDVRAVSGVSTVVLEFMSALPNLLDALAGELDAEEERSIPLGTCLQL